jgi:hypothetical protein
LRLTSPATFTRHYRQSGYQPAKAIQTFAVASSAALGLGEDEVFEQLNKTFVDLPGGIRVSVVEIVNELHLDSFIDALTDG